MAKTLVKSATRMDMLIQFRNQWLEKLTANEVDYEFVKVNQIVTAANSQSAQDLLKFQNNIKKCKKYVDLLDIMIQKEKEKIN